MDPHEKCADPDPDPGLDEHADPDPAPAPQHCIKYPKVTPFSSTRGVDQHQKYADPDPDPGHNSWLTQNLKNISKLDY